MPKKSAKARAISSKIRVIYNPRAGQKRQLLRLPDTQTSLEEIQSLFRQYQIVAEFIPTKHPGHATELAKEAANRHYSLVVGAGGDGTVSEVANGLINTETTLGILPLGTYMNTARMLSIPMELEAAVQILKIGRIRKIDVGRVLALSNQKLSRNTYFLESAGLGIEAEFQRQFKELESGNWRSLWPILKLTKQFAGDWAVIDIDGRVIRTRATLVTISNGPFTGAALPIAPDARLNDHRLTVSLYHMSKLEILRYFWKNSRIFPKKTRKIESYQGKHIRIETNIPKLVHADAQIFGHTPVEFQVIPGAINVISGFPKPGESALLKRTLLDP